MRDVLYLAARYLGYHRVKTVVLVASLTLILYLPVGLNVLVSQSAEDLTARAAATPLLVGAKGSPLELVLSSLYFETEPPESTTWSQAEVVADTGFALAIPLYTRFRARGHAIVATSLEYFDFRGLRLAEGRRFGLLGECVLGAKVAADLGVGVGDSVVSSPETVFDLAGVYPLKMHVVGVLAPSHTADDRAIFVDVKTAWVIEGLGHGHQDMTKADPSAVLSRDDETVVANASVVEYNEITEENAGSFHFHGDLASYPLSAVLAVPRDSKTETLLRGRYQSPDAEAQIVRPVEVMDELLGTILTIRGVVVAGMVLVGVATAATAALVFLLSLRLRRREIETMVKIGGARRRVSALVAAEIVAVVTMGAFLAAILTVATRQLGPVAVRAFFLS